MPSERPAILALGVMVAGALIAGLLLAGGPGRAAMERRDDARFQDLMQLRNHVRCLSSGDERALPETLDPTSSCEFDARWSDPTSGAAYRYDRISSDTYRLCADFEDTARIAARYENRMARFEGGCLIVATEAVEVR